MSKQIRTLRTVLYSLFPRHGRYNTERYGRLDILTYGGDHMQLPPVPASSSVLAPLENTSNSAVQPVLPPPEHCIPIFEVAPGNGIWWSMPEDLSKMLFEKYDTGANAV